jgi:hypothetical protein
LVNGCPSSGPDGIIIGDTLYSVFRSSATGTKIYTSKASLSNLQLASTTAYTPALPPIASQDYPRLANAGNAAAMVWKEVRNGKAKACVTLTASIQGGFPAGYDTLANANVENVDVAMRAGEIHAVWENSSTGTVMYRKGTYSIPNSVADISAATLISVYPNPASRLLTIPVRNITNCTLTDVSGRIFEPKLTPASQGTEVSVQHLAAGYYTLRATDVTGKVYTARLQVK